MTLVLAASIVKEGVYSFLHLFPYLLMGILAGAILEATLSRYQGTGWLKKKSGVPVYLLISLVGVSTPL